MGLARDNCDYRTSEVSIGRIIIGETLVHLSSQAAFSRIESEIADYNRKCVHSRSQYEGSLT